MADNSFSEITDYFIDVINKKINVLGNNHSWLKGIKNMVLSKVYVKTIFDDVSLIHSFLDDNSRVLDFGTGSGFIALLLASLGYDTKGIDIDYFNQDKDTHKTMAFDQKVIWSVFNNKFSNLELSHYSNVIPFEDDFFDCVVAYAVIEHIDKKNMRRMMSELNRVLKPNGILFISRLPRKWSYSERLASFIGLPCHDKLYSGSEIDYLLRKNNFEVLKREITDLFLSYPDKVTNLFFPFIDLMDRVLLRTPLRYLAHNYRLICSNKKNSDA